MNEVWVVDDDPSIRFVLQRALERAGFAARMFERADAVLASIEQQCPAVLVCDIRMPGRSGLELLSEVQRLRPTLPVVIMTAFSDLDSAVSAFQGGAFEYLAKPFDVNEAIALIRRAAQSRAAAALSPSELAGSAMLGQAKSMQEVFRAIGRLSQSSVTVLITGESGTGKELVARALHQHSQRAKGPFVAINTAAIPKDLLESELFGHERGAFTGAQQSHSGRFEQAAGGSLFLDEIGDMPFDLQTRLLRVLSEGGFYRVGGRQLIRSDARVITATHQDLEQRVQQGLFREDLFHRLNVIRLRLPPMRERVEDIALLAHHFLQQSAQQLATAPKVLSAKAIEVIEAYPFPGNVRQLQNLCHWLTVMAPGNVVLPEDLPAEFNQASSASANHPSNAASAPALPASSSAQAANSSAPAWAQQLDTYIREAMRQGQADLMQHLTHEFERTAFHAALTAARGRRLVAAKKLGVGRNTVTRKIAELGLGDEADE